MIKSLQLILIVAILGLMLGCKSGPDAKAGDGMGGPGNSGGGAGGAKPGKATPGID